MCGYSSHKSEKFVINSRYVVIFLSLTSHMTNALPCTIINYAE